MSYTSKQAARESHAAEQQGAKPSAQLFSDQRTSTSAQLKQQHMMGAVQRMSAEEEEPLQGKFATLQRAEDEELLQGKFTTAQLMEEEEPIQGKFDTLQRASAEEEEPLQGKFNSIAPAQLEQKPNNTGLPDNLKSGIENMSGFSMDDVKVHYNSDKPAQLNAHAYAQGTDIHVAPGQEQHLPHEAWHVVQQKQGRVQPTMQMKAGVPVNDDVGLEHEADVMGAKSLNQSVQFKLNQERVFEAEHPVQQQSGISANSFTTQLKTTIKLSPQSVKQSWTDGTESEWTVGKQMRANLDWADPRIGSEPGAGNKDMMDELSSDFEKANFIRGHLLNNNLGGLGIWENMFPITTNANVQHLSTAERYAKQYLINAKTEDDTNGIDKNSSEDDRHQVKYDVNVYPSFEDKFLINPKSSLWCNISFHSPKNKGGNTISTHFSYINSDPEVTVGQNNELAEMGWLSVGSGKRSKADEKVKLDNGNLVGRVPKGPKDVNKIWPLPAKEYASISNNYLPQEAGAFNFNHHNDGIIEGRSIINDIKKKYFSPSSKKDYISGLIETLGKYKDTL